MEDLFKAEFQTHDPEAKWINGESSWPCVAPAEGEPKQAPALFSHQPEHPIVREAAAVNPLEVAAVIALELFSRLSDEPVTGCVSRQALPRRHACVFPDSLEMNGVWTSPGCVRSQVELPPVGACLLLVTDLSLLRSGLKTCPKRAVAFFSPKYFLPHMGVRCG